MAKRKLSLTVKALVVAMCAALFVSTVALAASYNVGTRLSINAPDTVKKAKPFQIGGSLKSSKRFCRVNSTIKLFKKGTGHIKTTQTGSQGGYEFSVQTRHDATYYTRFPGKTKGVHPNIKTCRSSRSRNEPVEVQNT